MGHAEIDARRNAATALRRSPPVMYQVPCRSRTLRLCCTNFRDFMVHILAADCDICTARSDAGLAGIVFDQLWLRLPTHAAIHCQRVLAGSRASHREA